MHFRTKNRDTFYAMVLVFGLVLLGFTFVQAYLFLLANVQITGTDLADTFSSSMKALVTVCIKVIYLCVMGWVGALVTARGVTLLRQPRSEGTPKEEEGPLQKPAVG
jgi:hypothetical protein